MNRITAGIRGKDCVYFYFNIFLLYFYCSCKAGKDKSQLSTPGCLATGECLVASQG